MLTGVPERGHHLRNALPVERVRHGCVMLEGAAEIGESRAFGDGELLEHDAALLEQLDDLRGAGARRDFIRARLNARAAAVQAQIQLHLA